MIVVELKPGASWSENTPLSESAYKDTRVANVYKAGEIPSSHGNNKFVVGTNESDNVSLKPNTTYAFYVRWIAQEKVSTVLHAYKVTSINRRTFRPRMILRVIRLIYYIDAGSSVAGIAKVPENFASPSPLLTCLQTSVCYFVPLFITAT